MITKTPQELLEEVRRKEGVLKTQPQSGFLAAQIAAQVRPKLVLEASYTLAVGEVRITLTRQELSQLRDSINSLLSG